jgi:hypothetical protein
MDSTTHKPKLSTHIRYIVLALIFVNITWIIHLGIWDMKSHLAGLKATFGALRILTERRSW